MSKCLYGAALVLFFLFSFTQAQAHGGGSSSSSGGGGGGGAIHTSGSETLEPGAWSLALEEEFIKPDRFSDDTLIALAGKHVHVHGMEYLSATSLEASYGVSHDFEIGIALPYLRRDTIREGHHSHSGGITTNTVDDLGDSYGFGDTSISAKYKVPGEFEGISAAMLAGLKLPTGKTNVSYAGERLDTEFQPGSGSWDPTVGVAFSKRFGHYTLDADTTYTIAGKGNQDTYLGDRLAYNLSLSYRIGGEVHQHKKGVMHYHDAWDLSLELNGEREQQQRVAGVQDTSTGGTEVFLTPGIRYSAGHDWNAYAAFSVPVVRNMNAGEAETDYRLSLGIGKSF